ncbi:unnamed protein product [Nesidiocoris tenuis]|uniref:Uncharacterized protein n=1 Tax=Nesidiocoris tenuis TaxID=355587 RepID=A0A6H5GGK7_9HEMI|nr:unnamed protein product [Nesidiocoris tenuis]
MDFCMNAMAQYFFLCILNGNHTDGSTLNCRQLSMLSRPVVQHPARNTPHYAKTCGTQPIRDAIASAGHDRRQRQWKRFNN